MVQHERTGTKEEQPREMNIEAACTDYDRISRRQTSPSAYELNPAPRQLERERGQPASAPQHCYARGGVECQRYVALDDFMPVLAEALAQDPDAGVGAGVIRAKNDQTHASSGCLCALAPRGEL